MSDPRHSFPPGAALTALNVPRPADQGLLTWTQDPATTGPTSGTLVSGTLYLARFPTRQSMTLSTAWVITPTVTTPTTVELSVFSPNGTRRAITANAAASFTVSGVKSAAFTTPYTTLETDTWHWLGILTVGGSVNLTRGANGSVHVLNVNTAVSVARYANNGTGLTATPASITPANNTLAAIGEGWWGALS